MKTSNLPSPFVGCWDAKWSVCNGGWAGARLAINRDAVNSAQLIGAWGGQTDANDYWTDKDGSNKGCTNKMQWNGNRI